MNLLKKYISKYTQVVIQILLRKSLCVFFMYLLIIILFIYLATVSDTCVVNTLE